MTPLSARVEGNRGEHPAFLRRRVTVMQESQFQQLSEFGDRWVREHCAHVREIGYDTAPLICGLEPGHDGLHRDHEDRRRRWGTA